MSWKNIIRKVASNIQSPDAPLKQSDPRLQQLLQEIKTLKTEMQSATNANRRNNLNSQIQAKSQEAKAIQAQSNRSSNWQKTLQNKTKNPAKLMGATTQPQTQRTGPPPKTKTSAQLKDEAEQRRKANQPQQTQVNEPQQRLSRTQIREKKELENLQTRGKEQARRESLARNEERVRAQLPSYQRVVSGSNRDRLMEQIRK